MYPKVKKRGILMSFINTFRLYGFIFSAVFGSVFSDYILIIVQYGNNRISHLWSQFKQRHVLISCLPICDILLLCPNFCFCAIWTCLCSRTNSLSNIVSTQIGNLRHGWLIRARPIVISDQVTGCRSLCELWPVGKNK